MTYAAQIQINGMWFQIGVRESLAEARQLAWEACWDLNANSHRVIDENDSAV